MMKWLVRKITVRFSAQCISLSRLQHPACAPLSYDRTEAIYFSCYSVLNMTESKLCLLQPLVCDRKRAGRRLSYFHGFTAVREICAKRSPERKTKKERWSSYSLGPGWFGWCVTELPAAAPPGPPAQKSSPEGPWSGSRHLCSSPPEQACWRCDHAPATPTSLDVSVGLPQPVCT